MKCIVKVIHHQADGLKCLIPASEHDEDQFIKLRVGSEYKADIKKARNVDHHRKGMRLVRDLFENQDGYESFEDLLTELKLQCGWYTHHVRLNGEIVYLPKSISFADMDQTEFEELYYRMIGVAKQHFNMTDEEAESYASRD